MLDYFSSENKQQRALNKKANKIAKKIYASLNSTLYLILGYKSGAEKVAKENNISFNKIDCKPNIYDKKNTDMNQLVFDKLFKLCTKKDSYCYGDKLPSLLLLCKETGADRNSLFFAFAASTCFLKRNANTESFQNSVNHNLIKVINFCNLPLSNAAVRPIALDLTKSLSKSAEIACLKGYAHQLKQGGVNITKPQNDDFLNIIINKAKAENIDEMTAFLKEQKQEHISKISEENIVEPKAKLRKKKKVKNTFNNRYNKGKKPTAPKNKKSNQEASCSPKKELPKLKTESTDAKPKYTSITLTAYIN